MEARCYFVPHSSGGQYQWWSRRGEGWVCDMWMDEEGGDVRHSLEGAWPEARVPDGWFDAPGRSSWPVRVW